MATAVSQRESAERRCLYAATLLGVALGGVGVFPELRGRGIRYEEAFIGDRTLLIILCALLALATVAYAAAAERSLPLAAAIGRMALVMAAALPIVALSAWIATTASELDLAIAGQSSLGVGLFGWIAFRKTVEYSLFADRMLHRGGPPSGGRHSAP